MANVIDFITSEDYARYQELLDIAADNKAKAPKPPRAPRGPLSAEAKIKRLTTARARAEAKLAELLNPTPVADTDSSAE